MHLLSVCSRNLRVHVPRVACVPRFPLVGLEVHSTLAALAIHGSDLTETACFDLAKLRYEELKLVWLVFASVHCCGVARGCRSGVRIHLGRANI